jgi:hypothetical protein
MKKQIHPCIFYTTIIMYLEILLKLVMTKQLFNLGTLYLIIFTIPIIILLTVLTKSFNPKVNRILSIILMFIITLFFGVQFVYFTLFSVPFSFSSIGMADQALDFVTIIKDTLIKYWYYILAIIGPFIVFCIFQKKINYTRNTTKRSLVNLASFILLYISSFTVLIHTVGIGKNEDV